MKVKQVSVLNMPIVHRWRAGKPRPYAGSAPLGNPKIQRLLFNIAYTKSEKINSHLRDFETHTSETQYKRRNELRYYEPDFH